MIHNAFVLRYPNLLYYMWENYTSVLPRCFYLYNEYMIVKKNKRYKQKQENRSRKGEVSKWGMKESREVKVRELKTMITPHLYFRPA